MKSRDSEQQGFRFSLGEAMKTDAEWEEEAAKEAEVTRLRGPLLSTARDRLMRQRAQPGGVVCPCCDQRAKIYKRPLNGAMAAALILIYRYFLSPLARPWLHVPTYLVRVSPHARNLGGDFAKLVHWGLLEAKAEEREDGSPRVGLYRVTELGTAFVLGHARVPRYIYLYDETLLGKSDGSYPGTTLVETTILEALARKFNYDKLMWEVIQ